MPVRCPQPCPGRGGDVRLRGSSARSPPCSCAQRCPTATRNAPARAPRSSRPPGHGTRGRSTRHDPTGGAPRPFAGRVLLLYNVSVSRTQLCGGPGALRSGATVYVPYRAHSARAPHLQCGILHDKKPRLTSAGAYCQWTYSGLGASTGHTPAHAPHSMQVSASIT